MVAKQVYVYMMASGKRGTLYTGVTSNLVYRIQQHREHFLPDSFTARYNVNRLVWFEAQDSAESAIRREKQIKEWRRAWKVEMIQEANPTWRDLFEDIVG